MLDPADALHALLEAVEAEGKAARAVRSPLTAPCEELVSLFTSKVVVTVKDCYSGAAGFEARVSETVVRTSPHTPVGPKPGQRRPDVELDVVSALRDVALAGLPSATWASVCSGCFEKGKRAPPPAPPAYRASRHQ